MLQHSLTTFRWTKIIVLNIGGTPPYLVLKSSHKKAQNFLTLKSSDFPSLPFNINMDPQRLELMLNVFQGLLKLRKTKVTPLYLF